MKETKKLEDIKHKNNYQKIINLPAPISKVHPQMSKAKRAAQFIPFMALSGFAEAINETTRIVNQKIELGEDELELINKKILYLIKKLDENPNIQVTYFQKDCKKDGGVYKQIEGRIKKINLVEKYILFADLTIIKFENIYKIDGSIFDIFEFD